MVVANFVGKCHSQIVRCHGTSRHTSSNNGTSVFDKLVGSFFHVFGERAILHKYQLAS